ncbi:MAG: c-type cytochrome, partial [Verrucomicrobiales bacterium]|nr:c-type cytochrome [Verrucomicrobiales bacterium]
MKITIAVFGLMMMGAAVVSAHPAQAEPVEYPLVVGFERFYSALDEDEYLAEGGMLLLNELNCVRCHTPPEKLKPSLTGRQATQLQGVGSRMDALDIELMLRNPRFVKRGTIMPSLFAGADRDLKEIEALKHFLVSQKQAVKPMPEGEEEAGRVLYHEIGCVACHAPETGYRPAGFPEGEKLELLGLPSVPLSMVDRYDRDSLGRFLLDPQHVRPSGRMPNMKLSEREAADLATYLKSGPQVELPKNLAAELKGGADFKVDPALVKRGGEIFLEKKCVACHTHPGAEKLAVKVAKPLLDLQWKQAAGCLADSPQSGGVPWYYLDEGQKKAIRLALKGLAKTTEPTVAQQIDHTMMRFDCYACHTRDGKGGPELSREPFFGVREIGAMSLGRWGNLPPPLDLVGRKLTAPWFEKILWGEGGEVRPYVSTRMPGFRKEDVEDLVKAFEQVDKKVPPVEIDVSGLPRYQRGHYGRDLLGINKKGLGCVNCHGMKGVKSLGAPVIDLTHTVKRLRPEYFKELLLDPQGTNPGTLMPPMFMGRKKANQEIEQLWTYLKEIDQRRLPDGLLKGDDYEVKPGKGGRPVVFRTFLEGVGTQAIAVGFPGGLNAAFDAEEVRWKIAWRGKFLDALGTWDDRYCTPAVPLGEKVVKIQAGMPFTIELYKPTKERRALGSDASYEMKGFRLDKQGVPTFLYLCQGMRV